MVSEATISAFIKTAERYLEKNIQEVPSFTQIVDYRGTVLGEAFNSVEEKSLTSSHSEIRAIENAQKSLQEKFLYKTHLLTILEPCTMCAGAIIQARIESITYFAEQKKIPGISEFSLEYILSSNHFPRLQFLPNSEMESAITLFFKKLRL